MNETLRIRAMTLEDIDRVYEIELLSYSSPWPVESFLSDLKRPVLAHYLVAELEGEIVGYTGFWLIVDEAHITTLAVHPDWRRRRVGEALMLALAENADRLGAKWLTLEVRVSNHAAHNLYLKFGFKDIALRKGYYSDNGEDAIVMWTGHLREQEFGDNLAQIKSAISADIPRRQEDEALG